MRPRPSLLGLTVNCSTYVCILTLTETKISNFLPDTNVKFIDKFTVYSMVHCSEQPLYGSAQSQGLCSLFRMY